MYCTGPSKWSVEQCLPNMSGEIGRKIFVHVSVGPMWYIVNYVCGGYKRDKYTKVNGVGVQKVFQNNLRTFSSTLTLFVY